MGIIGWIVLGLLAGLIARALLPNDPPGGIIATTIVGIVGAVVAGAIAQAAGWGDPVDEFWDVSTWITAIIGAAVLLLVWGALTGRRSHRPLGL
ncbi:MAG: GlsB/YeaQ/YmgE family stress response membrane protein [Thermoleophilia bacterium]